jgi:hypothetical protein
MGVRLLLEIAPRPNQSATFSYPGSIDLQEERMPRVNLLAPVVTEPQTFHLVLAVTDRGEPRLTSYRRVVFTVLPDDAKLPDNANSNGATQRHP